MVSFKKYLPLIFIFFFSIFALKALLGSQFYTSHDGQAHLARLYQFEQALKDGQWPPRWAEKFNGERGYPAFIFIYPLPYWFGEFFRVLGFNFAEAIKLVFALSYFFSAAGMYFFVRDLFKNQKAGLVAALLWSWAPYRFVKIFVTASLGEATAFAFIPWLFYFNYQLYLKDNFKILIAFIFSLVGLILSHFLTLIIFLPLIIFFNFWLILTFKKRPIKTYLFSLARGWLEGLGISAFYWLPALLEKKYTIYDQTIKEIYYEQFVELQKLIYSPWGYGAPKFGPGELSLQVGIAQWLVVLLGLFLIFGFNFKKRFLVLIFLFNFFLSIFLMLEISQPLWEVFSFLKQINTPWRFLVLSVFCSAFIGGWLAAEGLKIKLFQVLFFLWVAALVFYGNRNHLRINQVINYSDESLVSYYGVANAWDEYRPIWLKRSYREPPVSLVEIKKGSCQISNQRKKSNFLSFNVNCQSEAEILINLAYFPGWRLWLDKKEITSLLTANLKNAEGLILFKVRPGDYKVELKLTETFLRLMGDLISIFSLGLIIFVGFLSVKNLRFTRFIFYKN